MTDSGSSGLGSSAPHLQGAATFAELVDWGAVSAPIGTVSAPIGTVSAPIGTVSHTAGVVLHRGPSGESECGIWTCTPGSWECEVASDEFCYFLAGRATYTHEAGEVIEVGADVAAFFPRGWRGRCDVHDTVRKVYMIV